MFDESDVVYTYTRQMAIDDGVLVDLSDLAQRFEPLVAMPFTINVACTKTVFGKCIEWDEDDFSEQSAAARLQHLLSIMREAVGTVKKPTDRMNFILRVVNRESGETELVRLWMHCGPGDNGEPVITVMMEGED